MDCGAALARHYACEALRLCHGGTGDPDLRLVQKVLAWLKGRGGAMFYLPQLYQFGPAGVRDKASASKVVGILTDHGHLEQVAGGAEIDGKWRRDVWRLVTDD
jgi:hypothetical protein